MTVLEDYTELIKACKDCHRFFGLDGFTKQKNTFDGLRHACKECCKANHKAWREANSERHLANAKAWQEDNRERYLAYKKAWKEANRERHLANCKAWHKANRGKSRANSKAWYEANRERHLAKNKAWSKDNPGKKASYSAQRRALKKQATPPWASREDIRALYVYARKLREQGIDAHVDHIHPLENKKVCGLHCLANLQVVTATTNLKKSNRFKWGRYDWPSCNIYLSPLR